MKKFFIILALLAFLPTQAAGSPIRGQAGDLWADTVIGQPDFNELTPNQVVPSKTFLTFGGGTIVDRSVSPGRLYVWDGGNSRVLGTDLGACYAQGDACTPNLVIGQPSLNDSSGCNGDANYQTADPSMSNYQIITNRPPANAATLCGVTPYQTSIQENISVSNMFVDSAGNLYVPDHKNNRVLRYDRPFDTDTVADRVWGQADYSGTLCNRTVDEQYGPNTTSANNTLCFGYTGGGVTVDAAGNVWIADSDNNRVLRFPGGGPNADLVLGQQSFTTRGFYSYGTGLNQMFNPSSVAFGPNGGSLYVGDAGNNRILVFNAPFSSGMNATRTFGTSFLCGPAGMTADSNGAGLWVQDNCAGHSRTVLLDYNGNVAVVLGKDTVDNNNECAGQLCDVNGSIGIDTAGNVLVSVGRFANDVLRFSPPFRSPQAGVFTPPTKHLFSPPYGGGNLMGSRGLQGQVHGIAVTQDQLIVADDRLMFWNNPSSGLATGQPADGVAVPGAQIATFDTSSPWYLSALAFDSQHLWVILNSSDIWVYDLPLVQSAQPSHVIPYGSWNVLGGGTTRGGQYLGIDVTPDGRYLWLTQLGEYTNIHRVLRIRDPLTNPQVDVVLGQANATDTGCNRDPNANVYNNPFLYPVGANTLCFAGLVKLDRQGNVWVGDYALEVKGNRRLLEFHASKFANLTAPLYGPDADKIITDILPTGLAFDSQGRMVVGNGLWGRWYSYWDAPLGPSLLPTGYFNDYVSVGVQAQFDANDNLYTTDLNRARVLRYLQPFTSVGGPVAVPTRTPQPTVTSVSTSTPQPVVTAVPPTRTVGPAPTPCFVIRGHTQKPCNGNGR